MMMEILFQSGKVFDFCTSAKDSDMRCQSGFRTFPHGRSVLEPKGTFVMKAEIPSRLRNSRTFLRLVIPWITCPTQFHRESSLSNFFALDFLPILRFQGPRISPLVNFSSTLDPRSSSAVSYADNSCVLDFFYLVLQWTSPS